MSPSSSAAFTLNKRLFNPTTYARIRTVWFGDLPTTATTAPPALARKWFGGGPASEQAAFDHACTTSFRDALAALGPDAFALPALNASTSYAAELAHGPSIAAPFARELADAVGNASDVRAGEEAAADAALGLVLLLDQVPRNVFRGADQALVYAHYDRIARSVARLVLEGKPRADLHPKWRASPAYRLWFYMPLMHSEFVQDQRRYEEVVGEVLAEVERGEDTEAAEYVKRSLEYGKKHRDILERFGRYPHRNEVLGRKMTKEEREWLEAGGETFGTKK
ncbi:hypothetical protein B0J12DRAFT_581327 [Macrophomina phaseolina]|uniref:DUF924-domain-containing protein n=1 Tax=Macrophomina phaseolina TaxID=35725 RepID=A0ABQ8FZ27_9PEZI|nr:hypothetical protein B0J12DRAFT_581327 [Macrophomina phaseolina]